MNSPRSLEACRQLGINPKSLYYIKFKTYLQDNPEIIPLDEEKKKKRFENINAYREEMIEAVKKKREEIIKEQEKAETALTNTENSNNNNSNYDTDYDTNNNSYNYTNNNNNNNSRTNEL